MINYKIGNKSNLDKMTRLKSSSHPLNYHGQFCHYVCADDGDAAHSVNEQDFEKLGLHYGKYLKEVVKALDEDKKFAETIKTMDVEDIKSGKVAEQLRHVHEDVRKRLNELKGMEVARLAELATRKNEVNQFGETYHGAGQRRWRTLGGSSPSLPEHLGTHGNYFDTADLHKLMVAATNDLEKLDKERREQFQKYEMDKEYQFQERLKQMNETQKQEAMKIREELKKKHEQHDRVHQPGSEEHLKDVWEQQDHLPRQEFNPNTFFSISDLDSNNFWDPTEVRKLLKTEIEKIYDPNNPEDDPNEMEEEYNRMRERIYKDIDTDHDGLISRKEFLYYSHRPDFKRDEGWEDLSKQKHFTDKELEEFRKHHDSYQQELNQYGLPNYQNYPSQMYLPNYGYHPNPNSYYGYQAVDPNQAAHHPAAAIAQQQAAAFHQQMAYQQTAAAAGYQQPHPAAAGAVGQVPQYQPAAAPTSTGYVPPPQPAIAQQQQYQQQYYQGAQAPAVTQQQQPVYQQQQQPIYQQSPPQNQPLQNQPPQNQPPQNQPLQNQPLQNQPPQNQPPQNQPLQNQPPQNQPQQPPQQSQPPPQQPVRT